MFGNGLASGRGLQHVLLRLHRVHEDDAREAAVGTGRGHPARALLALHVAHDLALDGRRFVGELPRAANLDTLVGQAVPRPVALDLERQHTEPVAEKLVGRGERERRIVGRQRVPDPVAAAELRALAGLADERLALVVQVQLRRDPLHQRGLRQLAAGDDARDDRERVVHLRRIGLKVETLQLVRFQPRLEEVLLVLRILTHEELERLADAIQLLVDPRLGEAEVLGLARLVRAHRVDRDADVARPRQHDRVAVVDVVLRELEIAEIDLVPEVDDVRVPVLELKGERLLGVGVEGPQRSNTAG